MVHLRLYRAQSDHGDTLQTPGQAGDIEDSVPQGLAGEPQGVGKFQAEPAFLPSQWHRGHNKLKAVVEKFVF